jgi:hypothetical protein
MAVVGNTVVAPLSAPTRFKFDAQSMIYQTCISMQDGPVQSNFAPFQYTD